MNILEALIHGPLFFVLSWTLLHFVWQGALVALSLAIADALWPSRDAQTRYIHYACGFALMACMPIVTTAILYWDTFYLQGTPIPDGVSLPLAKQPIDVSNFFTVETTQARLPYLLLLWGLGVLLFSLRSLGGWGYCQYLRQAAEPHPLYEWQEMTSKLARRMHIRRSVHLLQSPRIEVPLTLGWLRPIVLVPIGMLSGLSMPQVEAILLHELAHIRRYDYVVNLLQTVMEILFFYHPAVWWLSAKMRTEREYCCDDLAVSICGNAVAYARTLTLLESARQMPVVPALGVKDGAFMTRIVRLLDSAAVTSPSRLHLSGLAAVFALGVFGGSFGIASEGYSQIRPEETQVVQTSNGQMLPPGTISTVKLWVDKSGAISVRGASYVDLNGTRRPEIIKTDLGGLEDVLKELRPKLDYTQSVEISFQPDIDQTRVGQISKIAQETGLIMQRLLFPQPEGILEMGAPYIVKVELPSEAHVVVTFFDVSGTNIRTLVDKKMTSGRHALAWDGKNDQGQEVENGIYFCRVAQGPEKNVYKVIKR